MKKLVFAAAVIAVGLSGCATRASGVVPVAVSATDYSSVNCVQLREQLASTRVRVDALSRRQNNAALADAAGVFLVLVPLGSIFGAGTEGELAQAKGEQLAIERNIVQRCPS
jgi:outer membrane lipoprotein SlyB